MATGFAIVQKALTQFQSALSPEDVRQFTGTTLVDVWHEARNIEKEQVARLDLRFMRRIEPYLRSLQEYSGVIEVFCQGYSPMAFIWGPIKLMLQLATNYTAVMDNILQAFNDIADVLPRVDRLRSTFGRNADFDRVIALIYTDIIEFHRRSYKFFRCKAWHFWFTVHWSLFERRFKSILDKLIRHCELLDKEAAAIHFSEMKTFREKRQVEEQAAAVHFSEIKSFREKRQVEDEAYEQHRQHQMAEGVLQWLSASEDLQEEVLHRISDNRQLRTCDWVLEDAQIRPLIKDEGGESIVWMTGIPGSGKSFLCSLIIQHLQTMLDCSCLYYYCGKQSAGGDTCSTVLRTLAVQLIHQNPTLAPLVHQAFLQKTSRSGPAMKKMISQIIPATNRTRIILDGVDECSFEPQREILRSLVEVLRNSKSDCKLLVCSREEPQIQNALLPKIHMKLGVKTAQSLSLYVAEKTKEVKSHFAEMEPVLVKLVEERLHSKANGMFLWVRLVVAMLMQQTSESEVEQAIEQLPDGLEEAYGQILLRIKSEAAAPRERVFKILYWVCLSYRPVRIEEVADGIALRAGQRVLSKKTRSNHLKRDILDSCAPLLEQSNNGILGLIHFSAREYLLHDQSGPFLNAARAHLSIAISCIINLTTSLDLVPGYNDVTETQLENQVVQGGLGLYSYAHAFWAEHTVAFLTRSGDLAADTANLISILNGFSRVCKHPHHEISPPSSHAKTTTDSMLGLRKIAQHPILHGLVSGWLRFRSSLRDMQPNLDTVEAQQRWKLGTDETYLSLIESRMCVIIEKILRMCPPHLPSHIDATDHKSFISRFGISCRFFDCNHSFAAFQDRDAHEASHVTLFPCLQCDFAGRGFRSRKDLEKHARKYHMSPEDFVIPDDIFCTSSRLTGSDPASKYRFSTASSCWNDQGRKALRKGFRQVLTHVQQRLGPNKDLNPSSITNFDVNDIREKVEMNEYEALADFKADLRLLYKTTGTNDVETGADIGLICDTAMQTAFSEFPSFAGLRYDEQASRNINADRDLSSPSLQDGRPSSEGGNGNESWYNTSRTPYWSSIEKIEFPQLVQQYGRNFAMIAEYLKTKTADDVDYYFAGLLTDGEQKLSELADLADARLKQGLLDNGTTTSMSDDGTQNPVPQIKSSETTDQLRQISAPGPEVRPYIPTNSDTNQILPNLPNDIAMIQTQTIPGASQPINEPKTYKRKPRPRERCHHCSADLHDGAIKKHVERFHTAIRKIWVCEDVSIDKRFLTNCEPCIAYKRYGSKAHAGNHLRQVHFDNETSADTLQRWMREIEEPNPSYQASSAEPRPQTQSNRKRQKTGKEPFSLPALKLDPEMSPKHSLLPSMKDTLDAVDEPSITENPAASAQICDKPNRQSDLLLDISFDNVLARPNSRSASPSSDGPPHRVNRALIKPDQVSRLPHLFGSRRAVCQDQVDILYRRLDKEPLGSRHYKKELENLTSLSRTLMSDLRDWRRHPTFAPEIPFSI